MNESVENHVRVTIEALEGERSDGTPTRSGTPGTIDISPEYARAAFEGLRAYAADRFDWWLGVLMIHRYQDPERPETKLDFTAPNGPTKDQIAEMLTVGRRAIAALEVLHELAPWTYDEDQT